MIIRAKENDECGVRFAGNPSSTRTLDCLSSILTIEKLKW